MGIDLTIGTFSQELMDKGTFLGFISTAYSLILFLPSLAVTVRRLHDINKSGLWVLFILVPIIGFIFLVVYLCTNSKEDNKYGINPKNLINENQKDNSSSESSNNVITQLEKLSKLKEDGILTQEEFDTQKQQILSSKEKITPIENKNDKKVFIISAVFVLFLVILGAFIGLKDKFNDFSFVKAENKFGIKEINNLINLHDDFKTSCEKLEMLFPNSYNRIIPAEKYYVCSVNDGDISLISYDAITLDGFETSFNYNGFQNLSIDEIKKFFRKKGYEEFTKEESEWVSFNKIENLVLKIDDFQQITYISLDKYFQNKNKFNVSENLTKVKNYVHYIDKSITIGDAFSNFQDCNNHTWEAGVARALKRYIPDGTEVDGHKCSNCGSDQVVYQEGCLICKNCGNSKCG
jgi:Txe/YoeB family toxin of Txe-Axe toxin-antitoxin module